MDVRSGSAPGDSLMAACDALAEALRTVGRPLALIDDVIDAKLGIGQFAAYRDAPEAGPGETTGPAVQDSIAAGHQALINAVVGRAQGPADTL